MKKENETEVRNRNRKAEKGKKKMNRTVCNIRGVTKCLK